MTKSILAKWTQPLHHPYTTQRSSCCAGFISSTQTKEFLTPQHRVQSARTCLANENFKPSTDSCCIRIRNYSFGSLLSTHLFHPTARRTRSSTAAQRTTDYCSWSLQQYEHFEWHPTINRRFLSHECLASRRRKQTKNAVVEAHLKTDQT